MVSVTSIFQNIVSGLNTSALLMVAALGLVIIFGLMGVINMAHGELMMVGAYVTYYTTYVLHIPFLFALIFAFLVTGLIGSLIEMLIIKSLYSKPTETLLATFAVSLVLERVVYLIFGADTKNVPMPIPGNITIAGITIPNYNVFAIAFGILILLLTVFIFQKTSFGKKMRATTQNRSMAECLGIKTSRVDTWTFAYGSGLAGIAGALIAPTISVSTGMGSPYLTESFMTVVVGGVQSVIGTAFGAGIVGEARTIIGGLSSAVTAKILVFLIIIVLIRIKPQGLFAKERR
jgi:urea transport system permease protein